MRFFNFIVATWSAAPFVLGQGTFDPVRPPAVPLAVRSPYLNNWLNANSDGSQKAILPGRWPEFWTESVQGWQGFIKVDGENFNWMGAAPGAITVDQTNLQYTSTKSIFTLNAADKVELTVTFLSPVYPDDYRRQSVTFSYLDVSARSLDGVEHSVQLYADVTGEWASGDKSAIIEWENSSSNGVLVHKFYRQQQNVYGESDNQADWGNWNWATGQVDGVSLRIGADVDVREQFLDTGSLDGSIDSQFRAVDDRWPVFAFARDLGIISANPVNTLWTIGFTHEVAVHFQGADPEPVDIPSYWTQYFNEPDVVSFFYNDYGYATSHASQLDQRVAIDSIAAGGQDYLTITSLTVRQAFGGLTYAGTESHPYVFLKEISSGSDIQTVDVLFPMWPFMVYFDFNLIKNTLAPLLENQAAGRYPNPFAMHDLGHYPQALGHPNGNDERQPIEECGNMILLLLSYAQETEDSAYLETYWSLLEKWSQYLIGDTERPSLQQSTDDFAGESANSTNLAIKGIIALRAMSEIENLIGNTQAQDQYSSFSTQYLDFWQTNGINQNASPPHAVFEYGQPDSYSLLYNIYADRALKLNFIPEEIYQIQSNFYATVFHEYGVALDTRAEMTKLDWQLFAAAVANDDTRDRFLSTTSRWIGETSTYRALTDLYDTNTGGYLDGSVFVARSVVGGVFSLLALGVKA